MADERQINSKELAADIRSGLDDRTLLRKYPITPRELREFKRRLDQYKGASLESLEHDLNDTLIVTLDPDDRGGGSRAYASDDRDPNVRDTVIMSAMDNKTEAGPARLKQTSVEVEPDLRDGPHRAMDKDRPQKPSTRPVPAMAEAATEDLLITIISSENLDVHEAPGGGDDTVRLVDEGIDLLAGSGKSATAGGKRKAKRKKITTLAEGPAAEMVKTQLMEPRPSTAHLDQPHEIADTAPIPVTDDKPGKPRRADAQRPQFGRPPGWQELAARGTERRGGLEQVRRISIPHRSPYGCTI